MVYERDVTGGKEQLGAQEQAVLDMIAANPFVGQAEIATALGIARPTVAAHIASLMRKGRLLGRGYVLPRPRRIVCVGAAAVDRKYHALGRLVNATSNPVRGMRSFGGVARNVVLTLGAEGCLVVGAESATHVASVAADPRDVTGAGDALIAGTLYRLLADEKLVRAVQIGTLLATLTAESEATVLPDLSADVLESARQRIKRSM